jgi:hypothetical protein
MSTYNKNDLLELLNKRTSEEEVSLSPIDKFIKDLNIRPSKTRVPNYVIYYTYVKNGGTMSKIGFFRSFTKKFKRHKYRTGKERGFKLHADSFDLSREGLISADYFKNKGIL